MISSDIEAARRPARVRPRLAHAVPCVRDGGRSGSTPPASHTSTSPASGRAAPAHRHYLVRDGSLVAWSVPRSAVADDPVSHHRRAHRQPEPAGQAASRRRTRRRATARGRGLRRRAVQLVARPRPRPRRPCVAARRTARAREDRPSDRTHSATGHPPRPRGQQQGARAQPATAPRPGVGNRRVPSRTRSAASSRASSASTRTTSCSGT